MTNAPQCSSGKPAVVASPQMLDLLARVRRVAPSNASVLIEGESGSGKEIVARALHQYSSRNTKPWVDVSCAALPEHLAESEFFGYEKGAFTGAMNTKPGLFELALGGTLFLDEIGELPLTLQAKLLRVLDGAPYFRLGGTRKLQVDVRVVAATNRSLKQMVQQKLFREDLYYRLGQVCMNVPPLRERPEDVSALAMFFLNEIRPGLSLDCGALAKLQKHVWPGNIRELRNVITNAALMSDDVSIPADRIIVEICGPETGDVSRGLAALDTAMRTAPQTGTLGALEREAVLATLHASQGDRQRAAATLGISLRTLNRRLREYGQVRPRALTV